MLKVGYSSAALWRAGLRGFRVGVIGAFGRVSQFGSGTRYFRSGRLTLSQVLACLLGLFEVLLDPVQ